MLHEVHLPLTGPELDLIYLALKNVEKEPGKLKADQLRPLIRPLLERLLLARVS